MFICAPPLGRFLQKVRDGRLCLGEKCGSPNSVSHLHFHDPCVVEYKMRSGAGTVGLGKMWKS